MILNPPFTVRESDGRALIVPGTSGAGLHAIAEALPYGRVHSQLEIAREIAAVLNWHPQLIGTLAELCRELASAPQSLTRRQQVVLIHAAKILKDARNDGRRELER